MEILKPDMLNERGFLKDPRQWNRRIGMQIAEREGLAELDEMHWRIIRYLREYYEQYEFVPTLSRACKAGGDWMDSCLTCFFRSDPMKAVKIAGIPEPGDDIKAYYHGVCRCHRPTSAALEELAQEAR